MGERYLLTRYFFVSPPTVLRLFYFMANRYIDLTGQKFGMLTVISIGENTGRGKVHWNCLCDCGETTITTTTHLRSGHTKSCGCLTRKANRENLAGRVFSMLTVISFYDKTDNNRVRWLCKCNCGKETIVRAHNLCSGAVKSCGCLSKMAHYVIHGFTNTRLFNIWDNMKARCYRKTCKAYKYYGAKGITICDEWLNDNTKFFKWALENGYEETLTIERERVEGNYEPSNCIWTTTTKQARNKTNTIGQDKANEIRDKLANGKTISQLSEEYNVCRGAIQNIKTYRTYFDIPPDLMQQAIKIAASLMHPQTP